MIWGGSMKRLFLAVIMIVTLGVAERAGHFAERSRYGNGSVGQLVPNAQVKSD